MARLSQKEVINTIRDCYGDFESVREGDNVRAYIGPDIEVVVPPGGPFKDPVVVSVPEERMHYEFPITAGGIGDAVFFLRKKTASLKVKDGKRLKKNELIARRALWMAFKAAVPLESKILHVEDEEVLSEKELWKKVQPSRTETKWSIFLRYHFGRALNLSICWNRDEVWIEPDILTPGRQSWVSSYKSGRDLIAKAIESIRDEIKALRGAVIFR